LRNETEEAEVPVAEVSRKARISEQTLYCWKAKYAGLAVEQVRQMALLVAPGAKGLCVLGLRPIVKPSPENQPVLQLPLPEIIPANGSANGTQGASVQLHDGAIKLLMINML
jgi:hypothetical protein